MQVGVLLLACPGIAMARVIHVPADSSTIQAGIDGALAGDTVLVAPGTYYEKEIAVKDGVTVLGSGADSTIVDGGGGGVIFYGADGSQISHFTVQNGEKGIFNHKASPLITYNFVFNNSADGIRTDSGFPIIINNTVVGSHFGIHFYPMCISVSPIYKNNIVTGNDYGIIGNPPISPELSYNDAWGNILKNYHDVAIGATDISADPLFVDTTSGDYHLQWGSPCIDAGDPDSAYNDPDGTRNDIGAFYYDQGGTGVEKRIPGEAESKMRAFPNPANGMMEIKVSYEGSYQLLDIAGREVILLQAVESSEGKYKVVLDCEDIPTGSYFIKALNVRVEPGSESNLTSKVTVLKR